MTNLEIAKLFGEEYSFKRNVIEHIEENDSFSMDYVIYSEDHLPLTEEQSRVMNEYGDGYEIYLSVSFDINEILS